MSGGIDSSVSALLLRRQGHDVVGVFLRNGVRHPPGASAKRGCCSIEDAWDARRVADRLDIPFYALNFEEAFGRIVDYFVGEYDRGATPNPCVVCNRDLKFGRLFDYADAIGAEFVATGHYARVERNSRAVLHRGADPRKDQSYFLFPLRQEQLARTMFPVGGMEKSEVRALAREAGLRVAEKPESMEICFVPDDDYRRLLRERIPGRLREGAFVTTSGEVVGRHGGHQLFTIGQRKGLGVALGRPAYVVAIDAESNTVVLGEERDLERANLVAREVNWIAAEPRLGDAIDAEVKIRYNHAGAEARVEPLEGGRARVVFAAPQRAIARGQAAVFYRGDEVLGGGWIE
ncbi:MAG: tRNA 2-thiouridine(34) synthase MnmA [Planctomycetes bacterium]|nr:tRNA 2-thiouridine(34) synthase MnmA [Planctomycetota bacterium]